MTAPSPAICNRTKRIRDDIVACTNKITELKQKIKSDEKLFKNTLGVKE